MEKQCPQCIMMVPDEVAVCPCCGKKFNNQDRRPGTAIIMIVPVVIILICIFAIVSKPKTDSSKTNLPAGTIQAEDLYQEYGRNEVAADQDYKNRRISVYGKVASIDTLMGRAFVTLKVKLFSDHPGIQCAFPKDQASSLASLSKGQYIVIGGKCNGKSLFAGVQLIDCTIIKKL